MKKGGEKMKIVIKTIVTGVDENDEELELEYWNNAVEFRIKGERVFSGDWIGNFREFFEEVLRVFPKKSLEDRILDEMVV